MSADEQLVTADDVDDGTTPDVEEYFGDLNAYVKMVAGGQSNALMIEAPPGIGKSYQIKETLKETVDKHGFVMESGYCTPLELYHSLFEAQEDTVLVLDDIEGLIDNDRALSLLKSATWSEDNGERTVSWKSTTGKLEVPDSFTFDGTLIMVFNDVPEGPIFESLRSRCLFYEMDFAHHERMDIIREVAKAPRDDLSLDERQQVADWLVRETPPERDDIDLRTLVHCFDLFAFDSEGWQDRARELFGLDGDNEVALVRRLLETHETSRDAIKEFGEMTGKGRRTFFNRKRELEEQSGLTF